MKLGIFGGTFDPIHWGHLLTAELTAEALQLTRVLFVPAGHPPHKQTQRKTEAAHRQAMVRQAIASNPRFELSTVDLDRLGPHYSVDTLRLIQLHYQVMSDQCYFIIGADSLLNLPTWHQPTTLISLCRLAVVRRPAYQPNLTQLEMVIPNLTQRLDWVDMPPIGLASSDIRQRVQLGQSIRYQVPLEVESYIQHHHLYQNP